MLLRAFFTVCLIGFATGSPISEEDDEIGQLKGPTALFSLGAGEIFHPNRIVGGEAAGENEFPSLVDVRMAFLSGRNYHACGGAIISENWVLTAAHCAQRSASSYMLVAGEYDFAYSSGSEQTVSVEKVIVHDAYNPSTVENDVALMKVTPPFVLNNRSVAAIKCAKPGFQSPEVAVVTGWGALESGGDSPDILQKVSVPFVKDDVCVRAYKNINDIVSTMCCYGEKGKDSCQGDSGGPLYGFLSNNEPYHIGIVSWGYGCAEANYPGVYTRTSAFYNWIQDTMAANS